MSDIDRVRQMADEGRITTQEADQLIAVLRDVEAAEANLEAAGSAGSPARYAYEGDPTQGAEASVAVEASPTRPSAPHEVPLATATDEPAPPPIGAAQVTAQPPARPPQPPDHPPAQPPGTQNTAPPPAQPPAQPPVHPPAQPPGPPQTTAPPPAHPPAHHTAHSESFEAVREATRKAAREAREAAREATRDARDLAREAAREARDAAKHAAREARDSAREATREASRFARDTGREMKQAVTGLGRLEVGDIGQRPDKAIAPAGTPWVIVEMISGDLDVSVDPTLDGPVAEGGPGNIEIERDAEGYKVKFMPDRGNLIDRFLSSVHSGDLNIKIPPHFGLAVQATAGDVDLRGVKYLRGRLRAGDVSADLLHGVDFALMAGEFDATLDLQGGDHVVTVGAGEAQVALPAHADVTVTGRVSIGDLDAQVPGLEERGVGLGGEVAGTLGAGGANLRLRVTTGDLTISQARADPDTGHERG